MTRERSSLSNVKNAICTEEQENDKKSKSRFTGCSTLDDCYNYTTERYDNNKCLSNFESCGLFEKAAGRYLAGCILSKYCNKLGFYNDYGT